MNEVNLKNKTILTEKIPEDIFNALKVQVKENRNKEKVHVGVHTNPPEHVSLKNFLPLQNYIKKFIEHYYKNNVMFHPFAKKDLQLVLSDPWINYQKKGEFLNKHKHNGLFSYNIWIKIPYDYKKEVERSGPESATFEFTYSNILGEVVTQSIHLTKEDEGTIIFFPSQLIHQVYPFFTSEEERVSIAGNVQVGN